MSLKRPVKTLLIITDIFPPLAGAGIKRILKFTKFLPEHGWRSVVLTAANESFLPLDPSLASEVPPGTAVFRTFTMESLFQRNGKRPESLSDNLLPGIPAAANPTPSLLKRTYKSLGRFLKVPDSRILWLPWAVMKGLQLCRQEGIDALLATGPSFTNFLIGAWIKLFTGLPLVLDVRDAWMADPTRSFERSYLNRLDAFCERFALNRADRVITTNPFVTRDFAHRFPSKPASTFDTIYNGYDRDDFESIPRIQTTGNRIFTAVHAGRLYAERTPKFFLKALQQAFAIRAEMRQHYKVIFVGSCETFLDGKRTEDYIREFELGEVVELTGPVSRRRSLEYQMQADLLLLVIGIVPRAQAMTYGISGKLFDYVLCQKLILALSNEGATRELILENHFGDVFSHEDTEGLRDYLIEAFDRFARRQPFASPDIQSLAKFDFRCLCQRLSVHLNDIARH